MLDELETLDPFRYLRTPAVDVPTTIALGHSLQAARDGSLPGAVMRAGDALAVATDTLRGSWTVHRERQQQERVDPRPVDLRLDRAWKAVVSPLESASDLPDTIPEALVAAELYERLFPTGVAFLSERFEKQWAESDERLRLIDEQQLEPQILRFVSRFVLEELRAAHDAYGEVLGITDAKADRPPPVDLLEGLREVRTAISGYALQLLAAVHDDPERLPQVRRALRPLDDLRQAQQRRAAARARGETSEDDGGATEPGEGEEPGVGDGGAEGQPPPPPADDETRSPVTP